MVITVPFSFRLAWSVRFKDEEMLILSIITATPRDTEIRVSRLFPGVWSRFLKSVLIIDIISVS
jgi:hypothetical protein